MDQLDRAPASVRARRSGFMASMQALHKACVSEVPDPIGVDSTRACKCEEPASSPSRCFSWEALDVELPPSSLSSQKRDSN